MLAHGLHVFVVFFAAVVHVGHVQHGLAGNELPGAQHEALVVVPVEAAQRQAVVQVLDYAGHQFGLADVVVVARFAAALGAFQRAFGHFEVGEVQFGVDDFDVGYRIDAPGHVGNVFVIEAAHDVGDGVGFANVGQKLVAQPLAARGAGHQPGNVHKLHHGGQHALRVGDGGQLVQARVGHGHHAHVGLNGAKRVVGGFYAGLGEADAQSGFAHVGHGEDDAFKAHV